MILELAEHVEFSADHFLLLLALPRAHGAQPRERAGRRALDLAVVAHPMEHEPRQREVGGVVAVTVGLRPRLAEQRGQEEADPQADAEGDEAEGGGDLELHEQLAAEHGRHAERHRQVAGDHGHASARERLGRALCAPLVPRRLVRVCNERGGR
eukprot:2914139-Prymnesium_polylepis.2